MSIEIRIPSVGESVQEAILAEWFKKDGDLVAKDDPLFVIETDKVTLEVAAEQDGVLKILVPDGETVTIGQVVGMLEPVSSDASAEKAAKQKAVLPTTEKAKAPEPVAAPPVSKEKSVPGGAPVPETGLSLSPSVRRLVAEHNLDATQLSGTGPGNRITKGDVLIYLERGFSKLSEKVPVPAPTAAPAVSDKALEERKPMTPIRKTIAARLLESKQGTAMLTTFNEIDMHRAMDIRSAYKEAFSKRHGVNLGFMSFFIKACVEALKEIPEINAYIDGNDIIYHHYCHIGVAIGSEKGLVVPVIRNVQDMGFAQVEQAIVDYVVKIKENRLQLADLEGGTFTVSNGGVYGSLLSTPILNTPQSGILGMHKIEKRPVVADDEIVIRPMMYVALSYDHRIVDGKGAVTFLKRVKEFVENPERILLEV